MVAKKPTKRSADSAAKAKKAPVKKKVAMPTGGQSKKTPAKKTVAKKTTTTSSKTVTRSYTLSWVDVTGRNLVIVESPAKGKTIKWFLGSEREVKASFGHVSDLPQKTLGIDVKDNFTPTYEVSPDKKKVIAELKRDAKVAKQIWLATDEDREGEAIARHVAKTLGLPVDKTPRIVFHEITKDAIQAAVANPRYIDMNLVDAQQARRILDRLVWFSVSPVLWTKIRRGLSAGRVQSVAVKMIVEKEREIQNFKPEESWTLKTDLIHDSSSLSCELNKDAGKSVKLHNLADAEAMVKSLTSNLTPQVETNEKTGHLIHSYPADCSFSLTDIGEKTSTRNPSAPFTTSTLQQAGASRLWRSVKQVMMTAQKLYESGFITYMRTDSVNLSAVAITAASKYIEQAYGTEYLTIRKYATKSKNAQEAHEAIRPTYIDRTPQTVNLTGQELKLYELIWARTVASQMASAKVLNTTYTFVPDGTKQEWVAKGKRIVFAGFLALYGQDEENEEEGGEQTLPALEKGISLPTKAINAHQSFSRPPARYTEAALVKALEGYGVGRPSTYAPTISTIQDRGYVLKKEDKKLHPTEIAFLVVDFLEKHFENMMNYEFTAKMEDELDTIAEGKKWWKKMMAEFYTGFEKTLIEAKKGDKEIVPVGRKCPKCEEWDLIYKFTRFGKFIGCSRYPDCDYTEKSQEEKDTLEPLRQKYEWKPCPEGGTIVVKMGRFGPFLTSSEYPAVKWISSIPDEKMEELEKQFGGEKCDKCGEGTMHIKKSRRWPFLACNRYPDCKNAKNVKAE